MLLLFQASLAETVMQSEKKMTLDILRFGACWTTQAQCYRNGDADGTLDRHLLQAVGADHDKKIQAEIKMK
jgi:hypothetical protein